MCYLLLKLEQNIIVLWMPPLSGTILVNPLGDHNEDTILIDSLSEYDPFDGIMPQEQENKYVCPICRCANDDFQKLEKEESSEGSEGESDRELCVVCYGNFVNIKYLTCLHQCVCEDCLLTINKVKSDYDYDYDHDGFMLSILGQDFEEDSWPPQTQIEEYDYSHLYPDQMNTNLETQQYLSDEYFLERLNLFSTNQSLSETVMHNFSEQKFPQRITKDYYITVELDCSLMSMKTIETAVLKHSKKMKSKSTKLTMILDQKFDNVGFLKNKERNKRNNKNKKMSKKNINRGNKIANSKMKMFRK